MAPDTWVLYSSGFDRDPDPLAVTFVVGTAIADDIIESLQTRFPELQHSRRSWGEYSTNQRSGHVQMVCDARRGTLPGQQRAVVGAAHEIMLRCIERLERACHNGSLPSQYDADAVIEMYRKLDADIRGSEFPRRGRDDRQWRRSVPTRLRTDWGSC